MARCPFATQKPITGGLGNYSPGSRFKIVHHTTEGSTAAGAMAAYKANKSDPHFTVDSTTIYQHIDTASTARSLKNLPGGVQTNRDSAIQIEVVAFAGKPKNIATLKNVAKLCRWIETTHGVPKVWPNGLPRTGTTDPGGHNRNATNWNTKGGHYGHSHVPENDHWDPGYTRAEVEIIMGGSLEFVGSPEALGSGEAEVTLNSSISQVEMEITPHLNLITYSISFSLDEKGQATIPLDIAWERVISLIPQATKNEEGNWQSCIVSLAEEEGQTLLVATAGTPNATATIMVKVLDDAQIFEEESLGCP
ncbi:MAG: N-acetylmuramoyl-L-alanine amidase [Microcystis aeruginosa LG13-12]|jgi:hypothetical protein|uniref:N-acetylmuramoyl-L-alanine amidase n=1 Tax=Microcystis aeruginosa Ma_QC_B_20070730_S2 TaxID=2486256 RepID=A0A552E114_MICAE|nr:N-acetylmuramoyl-L-alanine amidase [Microcystis aeruginosa LG13-12]TRU28167.1 MAG: N-acetylmuramoyl-L-alanine amidase [Microcystis aeruginosa Ma_QC_B_20070730_S2]